MDFAASTTSYFGTLCLGLTAGWWTKSLRKKPQIWTGQALSSLWDSSHWFSGVSLQIFDSWWILAKWQESDFSQQSLQNWLYYFVSTKTGNISELSRFTGILRGQESFAQAVSFGINTHDWYGGRVPLAVNTILLGKPRSPFLSTPLLPKYLQHNKWFLCLLLGLLSVSTFRWRARRFTKVMRIVSSLKFWMKMTRTR